MMMMQPIANYHIVSSFVAPLAIQKVNHPSHEGNNKDDATLSINHSLMDGLFFTVLLLTQAMNHHDHKEGN